MIRWMAAVAAAAASVATLSGAAALASEPGFSNALVTATGVDSAGLFGPAGDTVSEPLIFSAYDYAPFGGTGFYFAALFLNNQQVEAFENDPSPVFNPYSGAPILVVHNASGAVEFELDALSGDDIGYLNFAEVGEVFTLSGTVSVTTILPDPAPGAPEPGTWALLSAGVGLAGAALRRRPQIA